MKRLFVTIMLLPAVWQATAQNHDYIYSDFEMKDGSIYTGYVSHQSFSEGTIKIDARVILKNLPSDSISIETCEDNKPRTELSKSMQTWLDARTWLISEKDSVITVAEIKDKISGTTYENAVILSKGETVRFVAISNEEIAAKNSDILATTKMKRPANVLSGTHEVYETNNHEYKDPLATCKKGNGTITFTDKDGIQDSITRGNLLSCKIMLLDSNQPYIEQIPFIETVVTQNNKYQGYITQQVFGQNGKSGYLMIRTGNSTIERVEYGEIKEVLRIENKKDFKPIIKKGNVAATNNEYSYILCDTIVAQPLPSKVSIQNGTCYIQDNINQLYKQVKVSKELVVNGLKLATKEDPRNANLIFVPITVEKNFPEKLSHFSLNEQKGAKEHSIENGTEFFIFPMGKVPGYYALFRKDTKEVVVIAIK